MRTTDLCDAHGDRIAVAEPIFSSFGGRECFGGPAVTLRVFEDNVLVRTAVEEPGAGRVLVVDGGGSLRRALMGDKLATLASDNGWAGVVIHGAIRDSLEIGGIDLGVLALATSPRKSEKVGRGERDVPLAFAGVAIEPGWFVHADSDGLIVSPERPG